MKSKIFFLFMCLFIVALSACGEDLNSKFGTNYNPEREKLGIPIIRGDWEFHSGKDWSTWDNPQHDVQFKNRIPFHASKYISYRKGDLIYELDIYYGSEDYTDIDGTDRDELTISYCYQIDDQCIGKSGWSVSYESQESIDTMSHFIGLDEAKEILKKWGLTYP